VIQDVDDLLLEQARIDRVAYATAAGHRVIKFEVTEVVPGQGRDAGIGPGAEAVQRIGEPAGAREAIGKGVPVQRVIMGDGNDLPSRVVAIPVPHDDRERQRRIHHQTQH